MFRIMTSLGFAVVKVTLAEVALTAHWRSRFRLSPASACHTTCGPLWVRPLNDRLALPLALVMVAPLRLTAVAARLEVFCPDPTV